MKQQNYHVQANTNSNTTLVKVKLTEGETKGTQTERFKYNSC